MPINSRQSGSIYYCYNLRATQQQWNLLSWTISVTPNIPIIVHKISTYTQLHTLLYSSFSYPGASSHPDSLPELSHLFRPLTVEETQGADAVSSVDPFLAEYLDSENGDAQMEYSDIWDQEAPEEAGLVGLDGPPPQMADSGFQLLGSTTATGPLPGPAVQVPPAIPGPSSGNAGPPGVASSLPRSGPLEQPQERETPARPWPRPRRRRGRRGRGFRYGRPNGVSVHTCLYILYYRLFTFLYLLTPQSFISTMYANHW